jgi:hypothetical protein
MSWQYNLCSLAVRWSAAILTAPPYPSPGLFRALVYLYSMPFRLAAWIVLWTFLAVALIYGTIGWLLYLMLVVTPFLTVRAFFRPSFADILTTEGNASGATSSAPNSMVLDTRIGWLAWLRILVLGAVHALIGRRRRAPGLQRFPGCAVRS